jgi:A/G-specific adenine glycosylase
MICQPKDPSCDVCPLAGLCSARKQGLQNEIPVKSKRDPLPHKNITAGIIRDSKGRYLIVERPAQGLLGGLWKFPGGEAGPGESREGALRRTIREEIGLQVAVVGKITAVKHAYTHFRITLHAFWCTRNGGRSRAIGCEQWRWVSRRRLSDFPFSKADRQILQHL